ncbi:Pseudouridine synthase I, TruA, alpha/beta domain protein [Kalmanozyma brasiliensis GHG001]|nr:Pseudouridine synthase I, TruA, alpha/beta domain protein [Kalmanozyma brasiliensis GHG001]KAF6766962.1 Pseudouridine synthase I, TruA, alpha/beta domain protein [Kalmanozyma brasiliensis GHG001]
MEAKERYRDWTKEALLSRIADLEAQATSTRAAQARIDTDAHVARSGPSASSSAEPQGENGQVTTKKKGAGKKEKKPKEFDFASSPCRKIALRFSYDGAGYSGLAAQNATEAGSGSSMPTVEGVLWDAMCTARLVDPAIGMDGAGFSRCGRTDRGVSAAGQVVALWVRSKKVNQWQERLDHQEQFSTDPAQHTAEEWEQLQAKRSAKLEEVELPYVQILNRILPASIRIQAWSPVRSNFSSRFDCVYRHYKYFFPAGPPGVFYTPSSANTGASAGSGQDAGATRLDINLMRDAARRLLGEHDFRNLCKIDASKQITNYRRRIDGVSIDRVSSHWPSSSVAVTDSGMEEGQEAMYVLNLRGTAFLYHQVRNIMAILFLVGARLEAPSVVEELMNTQKGQIAADRVKMRLAAQKTTRSTASEGDRDDIKWWLPVNATSSSTESTPEGLPMWMHTALSSDPVEHAAADEGLEVYETKPNYEMAADRPLVLWECGFLPSDVEWRVGPYDGALSSIPASDAGENLGTASASLLRMHKTWTQHAISTELSRHFVLAAPSPHVGTLPSRTAFEEASFPCLPSATAAEHERSEEGKDGGGKAGVIPLGNGTGRGAANYVPMKHRPREETYEVKNRRWAETTGKRRAERKSQQQQGAGETMQVDDE